MPPPPPRPSTTGSVVFVENAEDSKLGTGLDEQPVSPTDCIDQVRGWLLTGRGNASADECRRRGVSASGPPLQAEHTATTVSVRDGKTLITDARSSRTTNTSAAPTSSTAAATRLVLEPRALFPAGPAA